MPEVNNEISKSLIENLIKASFFSEGPRTQDPGTPLKSKSRTPGPSSKLKSGTPLTFL